VPARALAVVIIKTFFFMRQCLLIMGLGAMLFGHSQNVGIGTSSPTRGKFEVNGAVGRTVAIFGGEGAGISLQQNWPAVGFNQYHDGTNMRSMLAGNGWVMYLDMSTGSLAFDNTSLNSGADVPVAGIRRLTIRQNGNVSINATEANASLFVGGTNLGIPAAVFHGTSYSSFFYEQAIFPATGRSTYINGGKPGSVVFINDIPLGDVVIGNGTSKVGINTSTPTDVLEIKQNQYGRGIALINPSFKYWEFFVEKNLTENASDMYVYYNGGNLGNFYNGDGKYYYYSDKRVKSNIEPLTNLLPGVMALKPCTYEIKYDNPGHYQSIGLIAQEARAVFPEISNNIEGEDLGYGGMKDLYTMDYNALGPIAIGAIQEQQKKLELLRNQIDLLKQRIQKAEQKLNK
jgi:hypothetical protein